MFNQLYIDFLKQYYLHKKGQFLSHDQVMEDMPEMYKHHQFVKAGVQFLYRSNMLDIDGEKYKISGKAIKDMEYEKEKELYYFDKLKIDLANAKRMKKSYWFTFWVAILGFAGTVTMIILKIIEQSRQ